MSIARLSSVFPIRPQPIAIVCALCDEAQHFSEALEELGESKTPEICANFNIVQTGLGKERLTRCLNQSCEETPAAIIVAGTAGAVNDAFVPGDLIVLSSILDEAGNRLALSEDWLNILTSSFVPLNPKLGVGSTSSSAATSTIEKSALRKSYGVDCVDMETATTQKENDLFIPL